MKNFLNILFVVFGTYAFSQCSFTNFSITPSACTNGQYYISGMISFTNPPTTGALSISNSCGGTQTFTPPFISPLNFTLSNLSANGSTCSITAVFSADPNCSINSTYIAPAPCSANNCSATMNVIPASDSVSCNGGIIVYPNGGVAPYTYLWSSGITSTSSTANNLCPGVYTCTVVDANGCTFSTSATVGIDFCAGLSLSFSNVANATSPASCDGSASVNVNGGSAPYTYIWNNGVTTPNYNNFCSGVNSVCVQDMNGCQVCDSIIIYDSTNVNCAGFTANLNITNVSASGLCDGSIIPTVNGGTAPYLYYWSNGSTSSTQTNLCTGLYSLTVTDPNGCSISASGYVGAGGANVGDTIILNGNIIIDSTVIGTISGTWIDNCNFDYNTVTSAYITSYVDLVDSTVVTWTLLFNDGTSTSLNATYLFSPGTTGVYNVMLQLYCGLKSNPQWLVAYDQMLYEGTAGLNKIEDKNVFIYPNPAQDQIEFAGLEESSFYSIVDQFGRRVVDTGNENQLNISDFAKGIYSVLIQNEKTVKIIRFVKQ